MFADEAIALKPLFGLEGQNIITPSADVLSGIAVQSMSAVSPAGILNTSGWVTFYWHWKHVMLVTGNISLWQESSTYLMGWVGYTAFGIRIRSGTECSSYHGEGTGKS